MNPDTPARSVPLRNECVPSRVRSQARLRLVAGVVLLYALMLISFVLVVAGTALYEYLLIPSVVPSNVLKIVLCTSVIAASSVGASRSAHAFWIGNVKRGCYSLMASVLISILMLLVLG